MDPVTVVGVTLKTLDLVHKKREGTLGRKEAQQLYLRIFCCLLWEIQQNMHRSKGIVTKAKNTPPQISAGVLSFFVRDALFSDFCIMCPEPEMVAGVNEIYAALERIHHWQRVTYDLNTAPAKFILGFANSLFADHGVHEKYNGFVDTLRDLCKEIRISGQVRRPPKITAPKL